VTTLVPALPGGVTVPRWLRTASIHVAWPLALALLLELMFGRSQYSHPLGIPLPTGVSLGILINGAILGMLYALLAFGLILVYRANRIINFAHAGLGLVPAVTALLLVTNRNWPYPVSVAVMLVGSALVGGVVELVMRRFTNSPRLIATVFTIGLAQIFVYLELNLPRWIGGQPGLPFNFPTPYTNFKVTIGGIIFNGDYFAIVVATAVICTGLAAFLRYTRAGIAIRATTAAARP
jgi:branched-subunit amino acid ABC-type transport system permease component